MILETKTLARFLVRRAGLTPVAHRIRMLWHKSDYEDRFAELLLASIRPGDCVWDVGANVGYYTELFSKIARHVVAFEPVAANYRQLQSRQIENVDCLQVALGDRSGEAEIVVDGQSSSLAHSVSSAASRQSVTIVRGDDLEQLPQPSLVKVDVEGFEMEVIRGMQRTLGSVRALFVEVHFQVLDERGMRQAPAAIVKDLKRMGFSRIEWPDASHLAAFRT